MMKEQLPSFMRAALALESIAWSLKLIAFSLLLMLLMTLIEWAVWWSG